MQIDLPGTIEQQLQAEWGDLSQVVKETLAIESYRQAKLSLGQVAEMLGLGVIETQTWLAGRGVPINYSREDLESDCRTVNGLLGDSRR